MKFKRERTQRAQPQYRLIGLSNIASWNRNCQIDGAVEPSLRYAYELSFGPIEIQSNNINDLYRTLRNLG
jgi:hypothetical protein